MIKNYFSLDLILVSQLSEETGAVLTGKITYEQLFTIHRLTERKESTSDPFNEKKLNTKRINNEFQRHLNEKKLNEIKSYLQKEIDDGNSKPLFPSSVIISLDIHEDNSEDLTEKQIEKYYHEELNSCFLISTDNAHLKKLYIPKNKELALIVDGQHRFYGLKKFYDSLTEEKQKNINNFEFITTILLGYDSFQVGEVFANVNFNQKPVNRSLFYDIFGASSINRNEIQLAHFLALHLQNNEDSPLNDMIKLLGKGNGLFSQAFFVEKILLHFKDDGVWKELYEDFKNNGKSFLAIPRFIKVYFNSIEDNYSVAWPERIEKNGEMVYRSSIYEYVLCKTTGMGALFRLIKDIFPEANKIHDSKLKTYLDKIFSKINSKQAEELFSKNGEFGGAGSEGLQIKLYRKLKTKLGL